MIRSLMQSEKTHQHILAFADGERRISNILQLSELIHQAARNNMLGMAETIRWLQDQQQNRNTKETELRLESDDDLVKIVTIHKSKGLEYPIVYCPYVGRPTFQAKKQPPIFTFYDNEQACAEIGSDNVEMHQALKVEEESAEDTRLLYVALTRAKYQCHVVCFSERMKGLTDRTALGWLLSNGYAGEDKEEFYTRYRHNLNRLVNSGASVSLVSLPEYSDDIRYSNDCLLYTSPSPRDS